MAYLHQLCDGIGRAGGHSRLSSDAERLKTKYQATAQPHATIAVLRCQLGGLQYLRGRRGRGEEQGGRGNVEGVRGGRRHRG